MDMVLNSWPSSSVGILLMSHLSVTYRTNSDSALHQSAMNPKPQEVFSGGSQELQPKRGEGGSSDKDIENLSFIHEQRANPSCKPLKTQKSWCQREADVDAW